MDCDGTLTPKDIALFPVVENHALSEPARAEADRTRSAYLPKYRAHTATPEDDIAWITGDIGVFIRDGLTRQAAEQAIREHGVMRAGAADCLRMLKDAGVPVGIVSFGIRQFIEAMLEANGVADCVDSVMATQLTFSDDGRVIGYEPDTMVTPSRKGEWSRRFAAEFHIRPEMLLAVGDTYSDRHLGCWKRNRLAIAKNREQYEEMRPVMGHVVITEDFGPVAAWLRRRLKL